MVTLETARAALTVYDVDGLGLDRLDKAVLTALVDSFRAAWSACPPWPWR
ncbi:hypothetical protein GCM10027614_76540 [Micromonospora vulcania]